MPKCSSLSISFCMTFFCSSHIGYGHTKNVFVLQLQMYLNEWTHAYFISKSKYIRKVISLGQKSSLHLLSSAQSAKLSFILSISASITCCHLSSWSSQGYMSSCVGTFMSSMVISVQVEIHGISAESIGLSYTSGFRLMVAGVTLLCRYWSIGKCLELLI